MMDLYQDVNQNTGVCWEDSSVSSWVDNDLAFNEGLVNGVMEAAGSS